MGIIDLQDKHDLMEVLKRKSYPQGKITNHSVLERLSGMYSKILKAQVQIVSHLKALKLC